MAKVKKVAWPAENGEFIYVPKSVIDVITKTAIITEQYVVGGAGGKLVIKYEAKNGNARGVMEINDMGPDKRKTNSAGRIKGLERAKVIIKKEMEYAKQVNSQMAMGMSQVLMLIEKEIKAEGEEI